MAVTTTSEAYISDLEVEFKCFEADGTTPLNLTGGKAFYSLSRGGLYPFSISVNSDVPGDVEWIDRSQGHGVFSVPLTSLTPPPVSGYSRYKLESQTADGQKDIQALGWMKLKAA